MNPEWRLINHVNGKMVCKFADEKRGRDWLDKQLKLFPNGYHTETTLERYPPLPEVYGQLEMF